MEEISKTRMKLTISDIERRAAKIDVDYAYWGIPITAFEKKEHLVMLCKLFAEDREKYQAKYFTARNKNFPSYIAGGCATAGLILRLRKAHKNTKWIKPLPKPTVWRRIWNRIRGSA